MPCPKPFLQTFAYAFAAGLTIGVVLGVAYLYRPRVLRKAYGKDEGLGM